MIKGEVVMPNNTAKILRLVIDTQLRYIQHLAKPTNRGLLAVLAFKRLRLVSPLTAGQFFGATVEPVVDYVSNVWTYARGCRAMVLI